ncbi:predicted protein [Chaetoceros tenuissimus]|uniref:ShKT domain-containing protein n=1 Tax=Chaetoceros tenuissimus TaxID=426638 RepID=A0AAD3H3E2_9STRA|nr:predicted protein [Chaetoceros tenuissimus]
MKSSGVVAFFLAVSPLVAAHSVPDCKDLVDSDGRFVVDGFLIDKTCEWAGRKDTTFRCQHPEVLQNCPHTCGTPCHSEAPSAAPTPEYQFPSSSPTISKTPTIAPSNAPTPVYCEADSTEKFQVPGTQGTEMKSCDWAANRDTVFRCKIDEVRQNCMTLCEVPCTQKPDDDELVFAGANSGEPEEKKKGFPHGVFWVSAGVVAGLALIAYATHKTEQKAEEKKVKWNGELNPIKTDDAPADNGYTSTWCLWGNNNVEV